MLFWRVLDSLERRVSGALSLSLKMLLVNLRFLLHDKGFRDEVIGKKWICLGRKFCRGVWQVYGVTKSWTQLSHWTHMHTYSTDQVWTISGERERENFEIWLVRFYGLGNFTGWWVGEYFNYFWKGVEISRNWANIRFLGFMVRLRMVMALLGISFSMLMYYSQHIIMHYNKHIMRFKVYWKSTLPPSWT